ncbi:hypothetical protein ACEPPN_001086 [Leptodophora sp. 'Broadleaf-Isolate-01']
MADPHAELGFELGVAGFGFGLFGTTINAFNLCKTAYGAWRDLGGLDSELDLLRAKFVLQQDLLDQWERDWYGPAMSNRIAVTKHRLLSQHDSTVRLTLGSVRKLLEKTQKLQTYAATGQGPSGLDRAQWVTSELESSKTALQDIESLLASLYRLLPPQTPNLEVSRVVISLSSREGSTDGVEQILRTGTTSAVATGALTLRRAERDMQEELEARVGAMKNNPPTADVVVAYGRYRVVQPDASSRGFRSFGTVDGKPAVFEWKRYDPSWQGQKGIELRGRVDKLARLLNNQSKPEDLLTLHCTGYFDKTAESRFGFAFLLPEPSEGYPSSLKAVIDEPSVTTLPTLEDRYEIAYYLGLSISILHITEWLHKSIRSHNVLFLVKGQRPTWARPYLTGFDYSRPDTQDASSERPGESVPFNLYRHPSSQGTPNEKYKKEFDYYSFGVVMLEIGMWRPLDKLWRDVMSADDFKRELVATAENKLAHHMGLEYTSAVLKCLRGDFAANVGSVQKAFFIEVVEVLGRCIVSVR